MAHNGKPPRAAARVPEAMVSYTKTGLPQMHMDIGEARKQMQIMPLHDMAGALRPQRLIGQKTPITEKKIPAPVPLDVRNLHIFQQPVQGRYLIFSSARLCYASGYISKARCCCQGYVMVFFRNPFASFRVLSYKVSYNRTIVLFCQGKSRGKSPGNIT